MKSRVVRIILLVAAAVLLGLATWLCWVPYRDPGGRVIASGGMLGRLAWSPDGQWVQYWEQETPSSATRVCVARTDENAPQTIQSGHDFIPAGWLSRPISCLVLQQVGQRPDCRFGLLSVDPRTGRKRPVALPLELPRGRTPVIAPSLDAAAVWFQNDCTRRRELFVISPEAGQRKLTERAPGEAPLDMCWSPGANRLAFLVYPGANSRVLRLVTIDIVTGKSRVLVSSASLRRALAWSPDGQEIAFWLEQLDVPAHLLDWAAGLCRRGVTKRTGWMQRPANLFASGHLLHARSTLCSVRVRDGRVRVLLRLPKGRASGSIAWSPHGDRIALVCHRSSTTLSKGTIRLFQVPEAGAGDWRPAKEILP